MGAAFSTLTVPELIALGIFIPSGLNKIVFPGLLKDLWPTLPNWFWLPMGVYEITSCLLAVSAPPPYSTVGFGMLYAFMGGVFSSLLYIPDKEGHTHASGKGKLGLAGLGPFVPATASTALVYYLDKSSNSPLGPLGYGAIGFGLGMLIYHTNKSAAAAISHDDEGSYQRL